VDERDLPLAAGDRWRFECAEALAFLRSLPSSSIDGVITDPPYSSGGATRGDRMNATSLKYVHTGTIVQRHEFAGDNRDQRAFAYWCALWLSECLRVAKAGSPICLFTDWRQLPTTIDALQAGGWVWRGIVPWDKGPSARPQMGRFKSQCEYVVWGTSGASPDLESIGCLPGLFSERSRNDDKHHMVGKPTALMQEIVNICPREGVVLDPFSGSATTGVAALLEGRRFIGCEITESNYAIGRERLEACAADVSLEAHRAGQLALL